MKHFIYYLQSKGMSSSTIAGSVGQVTRFRRWLDGENIPLEQTSYNDILSYVQYKKDTITQASIAKEVNSIKHYFNYLIACEQHWMGGSNPAALVQIKGIKRKKLYSILTKNELESIYKYYGLVDVEEGNLSICSQRRNKIILGMLIYQGLKTEEIAKLEVKDIDLREGRIVIEGGRKSAARVLDLEVHQLMDILEYLQHARKSMMEQTGKATTLFFMSTGKGNKLQNTLQHIVKQLKSQYPKLQNLKQIRASVISHWLKRYNLREVQYRAGHRYISSTESYLINNIEELQEDILKYHPL